MKSVNKNKKKYRIRRTKSLTLVETLLAVSIFMVVLMGFMASLSLGEVFFPLNSANVDMRSNVRVAINWIVKDARQAVNWDIANNNPGSSHLKFRRVNGLNIDTGEYLLDEDYIEYNYDASSFKIVRNLVNSEGNIIRSWEFNNINQAPFYTQHNEEVQEFNENSFRDNGKLIVIISGQKEIRGEMNADFSLRSDVKVRNE